ncbi:MAG: AAA family ATPase [Vicinamibacterales bacterium]
MARADLLKTLFRSFKSGDEVSFSSAARAIIEEERKKSHVVLANELARILDNGRSQASLPISEQALGFRPLPKDADRGAGLIEIRLPQRRLEDVVLPRKQREPLLDVLSEFREWDVLEANALRPTTKLLFCGPPGCGKTVTAEAISCELGLPLLYVRFDAVVSSLLGETATNLRKVFDYASQDSWVVFFDEFDAIGRSRDDATEHGELKRVVNTFLQLLDGFRGRSLVIAATNFEQSLDPALWRRFDEIVRFERPSTAEIELLLSKLLGTQSRLRFPVRDLASELDGLSHAEVERICDDAKRRVVLRGDRAIRKDDVMRAVKRQMRRRQALRISIAGSPRPSVDPELDDDSDEAGHRRGER